MEGLTIGQRVRCIVPDRLVGRAGVPIDLINQGATIKDFKEIKGFLFELTGTIYRSAVLELDAQPNFHCTVDTDYLISEADYQTIQQNV